MRQLRILTAAMMCGTTIVAAAGAQSTRPDFSGVWQIDPDRSKALTEKHGHEWRVAGGTSRAGGGSSAGAPASPSSTMLTVITQTADELALERRFEDEIIDRTVLKLDGSVSVNASRSSSSRSTTAWKGNSLVTTGTLRVDLGAMNATSASGEAMTEIVREFVTTRTLMPDGTMQVESRTTQNGKERVSWSVLVRVKQ